MNKFQRLVIIAAAMNALLILLFPPFASQPIAKGMVPGFQGFYPIFMEIGKQPLHTGLLTLELMLIAINALVAWLVLNGKRNEGDVPGISFGPGILIFAAANLLLVLTFPPYESARSLIRGDTGVFEGFYFVFGFNYRRVIFSQLLYLECLLIAINALALYLLFSVVRNAKGREENQIAALAAKLPPEELEKLTHELKSRLADEHPVSQAQLGRHGDRRQSNQSLPAEGERRKSDRRETNDATEH